MGLEPRPTQAGTGLVPLTATQPTAAPASTLVSRPQNPQRWNAIAIHFSGSAFGSTQLIAQSHEQMGLTGLAYHVVIGNGQGMDDGLVAAGPRWKAQEKGISAGNVDPASPGPTAIDICLIGDGHRRGPSEAQMRQLVALVQQLQSDCEIPAERVLLYTDPDTGRGRLFPLAWFRQQLLSYQ